MCWNLRGKEEVATYSLHINVIIKCMQPAEYHVMQIVHSGKLSQMQGVLLKSAGKLSRLCPSNTLLAS